jgi:hypothetical protein
VSDRRQFYRKNIRSTGYVSRHDHELEFQVHDLSIEGFLAHFEHDPGIKEGATVRVRLPDLNLAGDATLMRMTPHDQGGFKLGFLFASTAPLDKTPTLRPRQEAIPLDLDNLDLDLDMNLRI